MAADDRFQAALRAVGAALRALPVPAMIIGGVAVIAAGVPRQTIDIDATVLGRGSELDAILATLADYGIVPRISEAKQFARERQLLLLQHEPTGVTIEISFAWLPFEEEALGQARDVEFGGTTLRVARPEDLIIYKAAAWRDRDRSDIERLLTLHFPEIDLSRVRGLVSEIALALDDPGRIKAFDEIVARARPPHAAT
ncbi:MAG TPA: nucleotidyl transferase AbiEii/AbiGii toxin family protein [Thermoanaerobaculia bacterium]|jgi:hypothetical protein|nr:nucleotidyl transferase AbiEii/AbiGii toxin family protein [Thermoanaerobaculia bacterium]